MAALPADARGRLVERTVVGLDAGGTFTDAAVIEPGGRLSISKRASCPADPSLGAAHALADCPAAHGAWIVHGTTTGTNALLERRGARTALLTTLGFGDVLEIGRQARSELYGLSPSGTSPLVARRLRCEVTERIDWQGAVVTALDERAAAGLIERLAHAGVESVAVCFLFSYLNGEHEQKVAALVRAAGLCVSVSSEISPYPREFERTSTTTANAFIAPMMARYLEKLSGRLSESEPAGLRVMSSNGGAMNLDEAAARPVMTVMSGPAGGVVAAAAIGGATGRHRLITLDMGGTSTDVSLVVDGQLMPARAANVAGLPLQVPMLDVHTIGAGGGSLVWLDDAGALRVGPRSAGADPGPVAYGSGRTLTVTDANVLLGRIPERTKLGGFIPLDVRGVRACFAELAGRLQRTPEECANSIIDAVDAAMARALRHVSLERGYDPAGFTLVSFGGAGGLHACALASAIGACEVLIPRFPGAFSAVGLALADVRREYTHAIPPTPVDPKDVTLRATLRAALATLRARAGDDVAADAGRHADFRLQLHLHLRYRGQSYDLRIPATAGCDLRRAVADFHRTHRARYGHSDVRGSVEVVAISALVVAPSGARLARVAYQAARAASGARARRREPVFASTGYESVPTYARNELKEDHRLTGPAVVTQSDATTWVAPGWTATVDGMGNLVLSRLAAAPLR